MTFRMDSIRALRLSRPGTAQTSPAKPSTSADPAQEFMFYFAHTGLAQRSGRMITGGRAGGRADGRTDKQTNRQGADKKKSWRTTITKLEGRNRGVDAAKLRSNIHLCPSSGRWWAHLWSKLLGDQGQYSRIWHSWSQRPHLYRVTLHKCWQERIVSL